MPEVILSDYFYGDESEEFVFFKIPRQLITTPKFKHVSTDAKLLYGMLLDRMSLSARNSWYDDTGRVYIYYSLDEICGDMTCGRDKTMKLLAELDTKKGIGLIERIKQGQGKPTKIYVKRFTTRTVPPKPAPPPPESFAPISNTTPFPWTPGARTTRNESYQELKKSIELNSVKDPVLARIGDEGTLEILSGQRRHLIATEPNYPVPTVIQKISDADAKILVAGGCQRQYEMVRKRRRNFVVFGRGAKIRCCLAQKECSRFAISDA